jgi:hypothetical protein
MTMIRLSRKTRFLAYCNRHHASVQYKSRLSREYMSHSSRPARHIQASHTIKTPVDHLDSKTANSAVLPRHSTPTTAIEIISSDEEDHPVSSTSSALTNTPSVLRNKPHTSQQPGRDAVSGTTTAVTAEGGSSRTRTSAFPASRSPALTPSQSPALPFYQPARDSHRGDQHQTGDDQPRDLPHASSGSAPPKTGAPELSARQSSSNISTPVESSLVQKTPSRKSTVQRDITPDLDGSTPSATSSDLNGQDNLISSISQLRMKSQQPFSHSTHRVNDAEVDARARIS